jgi:uncharacterized membrane protein
MLLKLDQHPVTLLVSIIWSVIALFFVVIDINNPIRIILSIPLIIFIPGYLLVYALFPEKTEKSFDVVDRIALGIGISIAIVPLIGIILNYSPWGITLQPLILSLETVILILGIIAIIRWYHTSPEKRYIPIINISFPHHETKFDKLLTFILVICVITTASILIYMVLTPKQEEHFTEFYILGSDHSAYNYPLNLTAGENTTVVFGIANHEKTLMNYSVEIWLSNQTTVYNTTTNSNETIYYNLWFMDKININLNPEPIDLEVTWTSQWEYNYTFHINQKGSYKLVFLLYTTQLYHYSKNQDYKTIALEKVDSDHTTAYRDLYLWINVQ